MRFATWNVNSIRTRIDRVSAFLQRWEVDVLAVQEIKCKPEQFPYSSITDLGYEVVAHGLNQWNGVALISRRGLADIETNFIGQPEFEGVTEARAISAVCGGIRVSSLYVPNGRELDHPHYLYKLNWLAALRTAAASRLATDPSARELLAGDWNIAPLDCDVWDISAFRGTTHISAPEREAFATFESDGWVEATRPLADNYTYWDYQKLRFPRNEGMRIDFIYASPALAPQINNGFIDRDERKGKGASDHVPVIIDVAE